MDIGDWIYFILIGGVLLSGLLKKKPKKQVEANPRPVANETEIGWEDILREIKGESKKENKPINKPIVEPVVQIKPRQAERPKSQMHATKRESTLTQNITSIYSSSDFFAEEEENEEYSNVLNEISFSTPEDAQKAFVLSEIFNRKY